MNMRNKALHTRKLFTALIITLIAAIPTAGLYADSSFSGERLKKSCISFIYKKVGDDAQVAISRNIDDQLFDSDGVTARCSATKESLRGNCFLALEFHKDNKLLRRIQIPVRVKIFREVPVAANTIRRSSVIKTNDIIYEKQDVTYYNSDDIPEASDIIGAKTKRNIAKGRIVTKSSLEQDIVIRRGEKVLIIVQTGAIRIRSNGTALQDAAKGASIRVKRVGSGSILHGRVATDGTIYVASM